MVLQRLHQAPVSRARIDRRDALGLTPAQLVAREHRHHQTVRPAGAVHFALAQVHLVAPAVAQAAIAGFGYIPSQAVYQGDAHVGSSPASLGSDRVSHRSFHAGGLQ
ncbi:hypothetical protein FQZ97_1247380 [compost metagenome]